MIPGSNDENRVGEQSLSGKARQWIEKKEQLYSHWTKRKSSKLWWPPRSPIPWQNHIPKTRYIISSETPCYLSLHVNSISPSETTTSGYTAAKFGEQRFDMAAMLKKVRRMGLAEDSWAREVPVTKNETIIDALNKNLIRIDSFCHETYRKPSISFLKNPSHPCTSTTTILHNTQYNHKRDLGRLQNKFKVQLEVSSLCFVS